MVKHSMHGRCRSIHLVKKSSKRAKLHFQVSISLLGQVDNKLLVLELGIKAEQWYFFFNMKTAEKTNCTLELINATI